MSEVMSECRRGPVHCGVFAASSRLMSASSSSAMAFNCAALRAFLTWLRGLPLLIRSTEVLQGLFSGDHLSPICVRGGRTGGEPVVLCGDRNSSLLFIVDLFVSIGY